LDQTSFIVVPTVDPTEHEDWDRLDRAARLERIQNELEGLGAQIRARLKGLELTFMEGAGAWTVRTPAPKTREELVKKLAGLPVDVATDDRFYAL
jgi:hypothetical protein